MVHGPLQARCDSCMHAGGLEGVPLMAQNIVVVADRHTACTAQHSTAQHSTAHSASMNNQHVPVLSTCLLHMLDAADPNRACC